MQEDSRKYKISMPLAGKVVFGFMSVTGLVLGTMFIVYGDMTLAGIICYIYALCMLGMLFAQITVEDNKLY
ncbi:MAG: hypothetical protein EOM34_00415 [Clostridia bacterium]|nr:hypothetical protein [Clostridia bacterium]NCD02184.1 hypothetical protein [Clostridia bacterium]